jgi:hypothetical protein
VSFLVFKGDTYYPSGGWEDYAGAFPTLEEACYQLGLDTLSWGHVVDTDTDTIVLTVRVDGHGKVQVERPGPGASDTLVGAWPTS